MSMSDWKRKQELKSCRFIARQWAFGYVSTQNLIKALKKYETLRRSK